ncbi:MAG: hypothetical protein IPP06_16365 [Saprospiraceae bacterium]|nr:hypothetical protein [Candidatus Vicinibacter affinis]
MKYILFLILIFKDICLFSQNNSEAVEWDVKSGNLNIPLPTDLPFNIKLKNLGLTSTKKYVLFIWDRDNEKKIEKDLKKVSKVILFEDKFFHKDAKIYKIGKEFSQADTIIESPTMLQHNKIYSLGLIESRSITKLEVIDLKNYLKLNNFILNVLLEHYVVEGRKEKYSPKFQTNFLNFTFPQLLNKEISKFNSRFYYLPSTYNPSSYRGYARFTSALKHYKIKESTLIGKTNTKYFNILSANVKYGNTEIDYERLDTIISELENGLEVEFEKVLNDVVIQSSIAFTFSHDIVERTKLKIKANSGFGVAFNNDFFIPYTNIGINYYFWPVNTKLPINLIYRNWLKRISIYAAVTFLEFNPPLIDNKKTR